MSSSFQDTISNTADRPRPNDSVSGGFRTSDRKYAGVDQFQAALRHSDEYLLLLPSPKHPVARTAIYT